MVLCSLSHLEVSKLPTVSLLQPGLMAPDYFPPILYRRRCYMSHSIPDAISEQARQKVRLKSGSLYCSWYELFGEYMNEAIIEAVDVRKQPSSFSSQRFSSIRFTDVHLEIIGADGSVRSVYTGYCCHR